MSLRCFIAQVLFNQANRLCPEFFPNPIIAVGGHMKFTIPRDTPNEIIEVTPITLFDNEGPIPSSDVIVALESSNPAAVSILDVEGDESNPLKKQLHYGDVNPDNTSAVAQILRTVKKADGTEWIRPETLEIIVPFGSAVRAEGGAVSIRTMRGAPERECSPESVREGLPASVSDDRDGTAIRRAAALQLETQP